MSRPLYENLMPHELENFNSLTACLKMPPMSSNLRRIFLMLMRAHYSHGDNYPVGYEHLRCMVWNSDPKHSTLTIEQMHNYDPSKTAIFPGIFVGSGGLSSNVQVIGAYGGMDDDAGSRVINVSENSATVVIRHVGRTETDAFDMADMSMDFIKAMAYFIADDMGAGKIRPTGYGAADKKDQPPENFYAVDLAVSIVYNHRVATILEGHRIAQIQVAINATPT